MLTSSSAWIVVACGQPLQNILIANNSQRNKDPHKHINLYSICTYVVVVET